MRDRFFARPAFALLLAGLVAGCGGGDAGEGDAAGGEAAAPPPAAPAPSGDLVAQGQQVFSGAGICMTCHGAGGVGTALAPNLTDDTWLWADPAQPLEAQIATIIREGVPAPKEHPAPMPPMGGASLNDEQINAVAAYVASL